jgi:hypothetical protein
MQLSAGVPQCNQQQQVLVLLVFLQLLLPLQRLVVLLLVQQQQVLVLLLYLQLLLPLQLWVVLQLVQQQQVLVLLQEHWQLLI